MQSIITVEPGNEVVLSRCREALYSWTENYCNVLCSCRALAEQDCPVSPSLSLLSSYQEKSKIFIITFLGIFIFSISNGRQLEILSIIFNGQNFVIIQITRVD